MGMRVIVLGGGLAGLSAAYSLSEAGVQVVVLEAEDAVGGMARSFREDGFTWDLGPHRFHTQDPKVDSEFVRLMDGRFSDLARMSRIRLEGRFFDYPLKVGNAIFTMPPATTVRILFDYLFVKVRNAFGKPSDNNFEDWVINRFGRKLYDIYFRVYNEKTWGIPCTKMSADWATQRISLMSLWDTFRQTLKMAYGSIDTPRTYVSTFHYPNSGGIGAFSDEYAKRIAENGGKILLRSKVTKVDVSGGRITGISYTGGRVDVGVDDLVFSTIPITDFLDAMDPKPPVEVMEARAGLRFRSIVLVSLIFNRESVSPDHWIYLPELMYKANRISEARNFSPSNAPSGKTIIGAEITCQLGDEVWCEDGESLARRVMEDMVAMGLVKKEEYVGSKIRYIPWAYPIYEIGYKTNLERTTSYLNGLKNLRFFGRNGLFRYNNMDHSISMGQTAAASVTDKNTDYMRIATEGHWFG